MSINNIKKSVLTEKTLQGIADILADLTDSKVDQLYIHLDFLNSYTKKFLHKPGLYPEISIEEFKCLSLDEIYNQSKFDALNFAQLCGM